MNNMNKDWKCPVCDTLNSGQRCIVCGKLKSELEDEVKMCDDSAAEAKCYEDNALIDDTKNEADSKANSKKKSSKGLIIGLSVGGGIVLISLITVLIIAFLPSRDMQPKDTKPISHETKGNKADNEENTKDKAIEYLSDPLFEADFNISASEDELISYPEYKTHTVGKLTYVSPEGFSQTGENRYMANDSTAFLTYKISSNNGNFSAQEIAETKKKEIGGAVVFQNVTDNRARFKAERNGFIYYIDCCVGAETAEMIFCYPKKYAEVYGRYLDDLTSGFKADVKPLPDFEVIDDEPRVGDAEQTDEIGGE